MARLTKKETKLHQQVIDVAHSDKHLTDSEREFILLNYAGGGIRSTGTFFTPEMLSWDFIVGGICKTCMLRKTNFNDISIMHP